MDEHHVGIQADKPVPPWDRPGCFRLDCEPHSGSFLWWLAFAGFLVGICAWVPWAGFVPGLFGIPLNSYIRYRAKKDLAKMRIGVMHPAGRAYTGSAEDFSSTGLVFSVFGTVIWGGLLLIAWWRQASPPL